VFDSNFEKSGPIPFEKVIGYFRVGHIGLEIMNVGRDSGSGLPIREPTSHCLLSEKFSQTVIHNGCQPGSARATLCQRR
jgi:hypothetical protein